MSEKLVAACAKIREASGRSSRPTIGESLKRHQNYKKSNFEKANEARRAATHCKHGHPFSGENLRLMPGGQRKCVTCRNISNRLRRFANGEFLRGSAKTDVAVVESAAALAKRNAVMTKNEGLTHAEWLRLHGVKPKRRLLVDA